MDSTSISSSSPANESDDTCCICMDDLSQERSTIDCCRHQFCTECIKMWAKSNSTCPLDRATFKSIFVNRQPDGSYNGTISVHVIPYIQFTVQYVHSALIGVSQDNSSRYLRKSLKVWEGLQRMILHRSRSEDFITRYLGPDNVVLSHDVIALHLSGQKQRIIDLINSD